MFKTFPHFENFQILKFQNFKKYSEIRGATSISDAFYFSRKADAEVCQYSKFAELKI